MTPLDSDLLRSFLTLVEEGSVTGAAARLGRTQSAVSMQLKRLEDHAGHSLFLRARDLTRVGAGGGVAGEDITVHAVPRQQAPAWLMQKQAEGFELDLKLWAGLWMVERNPDGSAVV